MSFDLVTDLSEQQIDELHDLFESEWWTEGRDRTDIKTMLDHSDEVVGLRDSDTGELVAFARVLTDYVYRAFVFDVIVEESRRGSGLGRRIMDAIVEHPSLSEVERLELYCSEDQTSFYEQWGFSTDVGSSRLMRRV